LAHLFCVHDSLTILHPHFFVSVLPVTFSAYLTGTDFYYQENLVWYIYDPKFITSKIEASLT
jgi:hypothetical protein